MPRTETRHCGPQVSVPSPGTKIRAIWDILHANRGKFVELPPATHAARSNLLRYLRERYELDIVIRRHGDHTVTYCLKENSGPPYTQT